MEEEIMALEPVNESSEIKRPIGGTPFIHMNEQHKDRLDCFLHQSGPQTPGTDLNSLGCAFYESANRAEVRAKNPFRPIIGVADIISN